MALTQQQFSREDLLECARGNLFGEGNAQLPLPDMLMFDRITHIDENDGEFNKGSCIAEFDIHPDMWFFQCHFVNDPVMPGCLGVDALWQLLGFHLAWLGHPGRGRALGVGNLKFSGQVLPDASRVTYRLDIKRVVARSLVLGIANGHVSVDDRIIYEARDLRVGLFTQTDNF